MALSRQQIFDLAYIGLHKQGFMPAWDGWACVYLADDGKRCAYGHVDTSLTCEFGKASAVAKPEILAEEDYDFADELQCAHDSSVNGVGPRGHLPTIRKFRYECNKMEQNLRRFAEHYGLTIPTIPE